MEKRVGLTVRLNIDPEKLGVIVAIRSSTPGFGEMGLGELYKVKWFDGGVSDWLSPYELSVI